MQRPYNGSPLDRVRTTPMRGWRNRLFGNRGERLAARHLRKKGFRILARNYTCPLGEIDLIARDGTCIVFVEVKTRRSDSAGQPFEAVTPAKQQKLTRLALAYLKRHGLLEHRARFDVVTLLWPEGVKRPVIDHYENAFEPSGSGQMFS